jgi:hypothetical protein
MGVPALDCAPATSAIVVLVYAILAALIHCVYLQL